MEVQTEGELKRGLKNRHIQLIALGGAIGTGLFLGIAQTIKMAGPAVLLGYALGGLIAFLIMRQLGEMVAEGRCSIYVLVNVFTPPNSHDFASLCFCSHTRNHAK